MTTKEKDPLLEDDEIPEGADDIAGAERIDDVEEDVPLEDPDGEVEDDEDLDA